MRVYYHPASTTSRIIMMFAAEEAPEIEFKTVDIFTGEHMKPPYADLNPSRQVPMLEDGDFRLTESSAILKYLADEKGSTSYPKELRARARVNEAMDWFNTQFYRDFAYGLVYPQGFQTHKRRSDEAQAATLAWGKERAQAWLKVLDQHLIGPRNGYVCGSKLTIADYLGGEMVAVGELIGCGFDGYPNVQRWLKNMKSLKSWPKVHEVFYGFAGSMKDAKFDAI
ncbi:MAG TPA: glutathione S-transferase family protein [Burkholderiales bacterium]|nr:glutathione S-transferase family protein [Burkholderiales bacterium]